MNQTSGCARKNNSLGKTEMKEDIVYLLKKRAEIRRSITTRKSVQENKPDRIADLLEEAAAEIEKLRKENECI